MDRLSFVEMFSKLFQYLGKNPLFILIFVILILVYFYLILSPVYTKKHKIIYTVFFLVATISLIVIYGSSFWKFFDYLMDNIFVAIYFPNLPIYMIMVLTTIIIFIVTMFKQNIGSGIKKLNTFVFLLILFFLILSLNVVMTKNINVYSQLAIYSNEYLLVMIQMTMNIFTIWILILAIIRIIKALTKNSDEVTEKEPETTNNVEVNNNQNTSIPTEPIIDSNDKVKGNMTTANVLYTTQQEFTPTIEQPVHPYINNNVESNAVNSINNEQINQNTSQSTNEDFTHEEYNLLQQYLQDMKEQADNKNTK